MKKIAIRVNLCAHPVIHLKTHKGKIRAKREERNKIRKYSQIVLKLNYKKISLLKNTILLKKIQQITEYKLQRKVPQIMN